MGAGRLRRRLFRYALGPRWRSATDDAIRAAVTGRRVMIIGGSGDLGRAAAEVLARHGAEIVVLARRQHALTEVVDRIRAAGGTASAVRCDLADPASIDAAVAIMVTRPPEVIVNAAGLSIRRSVAETVDRFDTVTRTNAVNYLGPVRLLTGLLPLMRTAGQGHWIEISTISVDLPTPGWSAYAGSTAAQDAWLRAASPELRAAGITVSRLHLPLVHTAGSAPTYPSWVPGLSPDDAAAIIAATVVRAPALLTPWWARLAAIGWRAAGPAADRAAGAVHRAMFRRAGRRP